MHIFRAATVAVACVLLAGCGRDDGSEASDGGGRQRAAPAAVPQRPMTTVPRLVGRTDVQAHRLARRAGLELAFPGFPGSVANGHHEVPCVKIATQSPSPGERRPRGAKIWVVETTCDLRPVRPRGR
jgi:PASTA domain-containing protein